LLANIAAMYAIYHGPEGLKTIANRLNFSAHVAARLFEHYGFTVLNNSSEHSAFFDTITIVDCDARKLKEEFEKNRININFISNKEISLSFSEVTKREDLIEIGHVLAEFTQQPEVNIASLEGGIPSFSEGLARKDAFMTQKIFNSIHSESQMMRYLRHLQEKDISLDRSMIPLGSCTMKLNSASEMAPLTWPGVNLHPFVPNNQAEGYIQIIEELRSHLKSVTKFDEISFQPNSGATG
jgi:glycine dehydrogenase